MSQDGGLLAVPPPSLTPLFSPPDPIFHPCPESAAAAVSQEALAQWSVPDRAYETDLGVLQWVEELEQRVLMADLQIRVSAGGEGRSRRRHRGATKP